jgi:branched-chain amino acid transport system substrate-binding protein
MMGPEGVGNPEINAIAGNAVEGMLVTLPADPATNPEERCHGQSLQRQKPRCFGCAFQMGAYTATQVLAQSIKAVGDDAEKVADYLHKTTFNMPTGNVAWDAKRRPEGI